MTIGASQRTVGVSESLLLDASESYDQDDRSTLLVYDWQCKEEVMLSDQNDLILFFKFVYI